MTAAVTARLPGVGRELEAGGLESPVVHAARNAAEGGDVAFGHARLVPRVLERTAVQRDVQAGGGGAPPVRVEHAGSVGGPPPERVPPPRPGGRGRTAGSRVPLPPPPP